MIIGIGTDIAAIDRFQKNIEDHGERFVGKILSDQEKPFYEASNQKAQYLASRFAAKEAVAKALGTGFKDGLTMTQISVLHNPLGRPIIELADRAQEVSEQLGVKEIHLSLSHEKLFAIAFVVAS